MTSLRENRPPLIAFVVNLRNLPFCSIFGAYNKSDEISQFADCAPSSYKSMLCVYAEARASIRSHGTRATAARVAANRTLKPTNRSSLHDTHTHTHTPTVSHNQQFCEGNKTMWTYPDTVLQVASGWWCKHRWLQSLCRHPYPLRYVPSLHYMNYLSLVFGNRFAISTIVYPTVVSLRTSISIGDRNITIFDGRTVMEMLQWQLCGRLSRHIRWLISDDGST